MEYPLPESCGYRGSRCTRGKPIAPLDRLSVNALGVLRALLRVTLAASSRHVELERG
jgi:hypothetical protein